MIGGCATARGALALLIWLGLAAPSSAALPSAEEPWIRADTRNFTVFSNADVEVVSALSADLELLHSVLENLNRGRTRVPPIPTYVFIFRDEESFRPYKLRVGGQPAPISGYFLLHPHANFVAIDGSRGELSRSVVYHEYIHYFVRNNLPHVPLWFNEGLAEFYSTLVKSGDEIFIGKEVKRHVAWLRANDLIPIDRFLATETSSEIYNEKERKGAFYAQSWAMVHMLLTGDEERRHNVARYLKGLSAATDPVDALEDAFSLRVRSLERQLDDYMRSPSFRYFRQSLDGIETEMIFQHRQIEHSEVLYRLGYLLAHFNPARLVEADRHFRASQDLDPNYAPAWYGLGYLRYLRSDFDAASFFYERARDFDDSDFLVHFLEGLNLTRWDITDRELGLVLDDQPDRLEQARISLEKSAELRSSFAETWATLGATYVGAERPSERGAEVLRKAHELLPQRADVTFNLAIVLARLGRRDEAEHLIEGALSRQADEETILKAREGLLHVDLQVADEFLREGDFEGGLEVLEEVISQTSDSELFAQLSDKVDEVRTYLVSAEHQRLFEEAIDLAQDSRYDEAIERFETILSESRDPELRSATKENLKRMKRLR